MGGEATIPIIDGGVMAGPEGPGRDVCDAQIGEACRSSGFLVIANPPGDAHLGAAERAELLRIFTLDVAAKRRLGCQRYQPENWNRYRGWSPMDPSRGLGTERIELGPDSVDPEPRGDPRDLLYEPSAWPDEASLPGWRASIATAFAGLDRLARSLIESLERGLGLAEGQLGRHFTPVSSTLRIVRHPGPADWDDDLCRRLEVGWRDGERLLQLILPHTDSGCVTFVSQDADAGLQARSPDGSWTPVPSQEGWLAVNFGQLLETWTGGEIRATEHRVIGTARGRTSIPFFFEPAADTQIAPLLPGDDFEPFVYGDYVWRRIQQFPDYRGLGERYR
jgi:isopenicillin N synthase-like dioxygenase